ncbi:MAG: hypothetical protein KAS39_06530, partial [Actinomycetia bacterium]|nr:hypothetical protein [Actinomycetes bacterium]
PFSKNISALKRAITEEIKLNNFTFLDFQDYLKNIFKDTTVKEAYAEQLFSATKGNPLFSHEILKLLFNENIIIHTGDKWELKDFDINKLPKTIGETIKKRYQHFDKDTKNTLARAAAIGEEIDFRILKESGDINEGMLLDLIDFAKNEGLLEEKVPLSDDSLNFSSPEIRETLYGLIEEKDKKEIHETIGEVVENIFSQKITEFLPYLAYQYSMSGNAKKAAEASSRYINNFTPGKLTKEKKKTVPLDDSSFEMLVDFLRYLRAAYINIQLYPPASHLITDSIGLVLSKLQPVFEKRDSVTVSETEKRLIVEGKSIEETGRTFVAAFLNLLVSHGLKSITFQKNVTLKEIANFLSILKEKPESIKLKGGILKLMKHGEVKNITVNEKIYIIVGEDEELQTTLTPNSSSFPGVDLQKKDIPKSMDSTVTSEIPTMPDIDFSQFTKVFQNISSKPDEIKKVFEKQNDLPPELIKNINFEITKTLSSLDTGKLTELIRNLSKDNMNKEVKNKVFNRISKDKIFSLLDAIIKDLKSIKHKELDIGKEKELKSILKDIINISKEKNILPEIYNKLAEGDLVKKRKPIDKYREVFSKYLS